MQRNSPSLSLFFAYLKFIHYSFVIPAHVHWVLSQNNWSQHLAADLLQGHHFPSFIQRSVGMSQSPPSPPAVPLRPNHYPPGVQEHVAAPHALLSHRALWLVQTVGNLNQSKTHTLIWKCGTISRSQEASFLLQRLLQHRDPTMAPTIAAPMTNSTDHLTLTHKVNWTLPGFKLLLSW